jgi:hypothetical protein
MKLCERRHLADKKLRSKMVVIMLQRLPGELGLGNVTHHTFPDGEIFGVASQWSTQSQKYDDQYR